MKFKNILLYAALLSGMSFSSCTDFLDEDSNPNALSPGIFWKSEGDIMKGLTSVYGALQPNASWAIPFERYIVIDGYRSDEITHRDDVTSWMNISSFNVEPTNSVVKTEWTNLYKGINYANQCLTNIPTVPGDSESLNALKKQSIAEARFLRAAHYQYLASYFKDVPLVTRVLTGEEANNVEKETQAHILEWCAVELKEAAADLPRFRDIKSSETGRACRQAALAFLGRTYMLMQQWENAAAAYKEIIDYGDNSIHSSYSELFEPSTGVGNKENIYYISYLENYFGCGFPQHILSAKDGGWSLSNPSAGLFESYEFTDGTPFSYDDPRYNPKNLGKNRDPRLDYTIYYNGAKFMGTEYRMHPDYEASKKERLDYSSEASRTGFMWRKYFDENPINDLQSYSAVTPIVRYAEVLLSYLECMIESGKTIDQSLLDLTINAVRARSDVHMPAVTETNPSKLRERLRNERRIELAYEGIRYWDLLRWNVAHEILVGEIWGAPYPDSKTYQNGSKHIDPTGNFRWYVGRRDFRNPQDYKWPIPLSEQNINPNLRD